MYIYIHIFTVINIGLKCCFYILCIDYILAYFQCLLSMYLLPLNGPIKAT